MPVFLTGRKPHDIARLNFLDGAALSLDPAAAECDDQGLTEWMPILCGPITGLECDPCDAAGAGALNSGSMRTIPVNQSAGPPCSRIDLRRGNAGHKLSNTALAITIGVVLSVR